MSSEQERTFKIFFCYAHEDKALRNDLETHLSLLKRQNLITVWSDREISPGTEWKKEIHSNLDSSDFILLLISPYFMASDYCYGIEMNRALEKHATGSARVIPILLRPVDWEDAPFAILQAMPSGGKPVTLWPSRDKAFQEITKNLRLLVNEWRQLLKEKSSYASDASGSQERTLNQTASVDISLSVDWGEVPHLDQFYGRGEEIATCKQWAVKDRCRIIALLGIGGIGKTTLGIALTKEIQQDFESLFWYSLRSAPPLEEIIRRCILFLSGQKQLSIPENTDEQIRLFIQYLKAKRCIIVLDNFDTLLQEGEDAGQYRPGYENYRNLLQRVGEEAHQSCFLLTSREKPNEIAHLEGDASPVRSLELPGLGKEETQELLKEKRLFGDDEAWRRLTSMYSGNPLALKLLAESIYQLFRGDIAVFLEEGTGLMKDIQDLFEQQFKRLSSLEREIMYWLAIERESVSLDALRNDIVHTVPKKNLLTALSSLRKRSMVELSAPGYFVLQPVIMEYLTDKIIEQITEEIHTEKLNMLADYALMKAQAAEYVRETQVRLILSPIAEALLATMEGDELEKKFQRIFVAIRQSRSGQKDYAAGNLCNLMTQMHFDLHGYDFSFLGLRQVYFRNVSLVGTNFASARFLQSVFTENFGSVLTVALSPDGELVAAGTTDGEIRIWDTTSETLLRTCYGHTDRVWSVAFSPNEKILASSSEDQTIRLWDVETGACFNTLSGHTSWIRSIAFDASGTLLASASADQTVRLWQVNTGICFHVLKGHTGWVRSVAFNPDGSLLVSASEDSTLRLWDVRTGEYLRDFQGHTGRVWSVDFSSDGKTLASSSEDQTIRLWDAESGVCLHVLHGHTERVRSVIFSSDGKVLASGSENHNIRLWDVSNGQCLQTLQTYEDRIWSIAFSRDGKIIASGSMDQAVRLWDVHSGRCLKTIQGYTMNRVWSVAFSPDGKVLASGGADRNVRLWDAHSGQYIRTISGHANHIRSLAFSSDGKVLASAGLDRIVYLWEVTTGHCLGMLRGHSSWIWSLAFSPDGKMLASGSVDQTIRLWDVKAIHSLSILQGHTDHVRPVVFHPDGNHIASGSDDQTIRLWDIRVNQCIRIFHGHHGRIWSLNFSSDGQVLVSGGEDQVIRLWDVNTGDCIATLQGHTKQITAVAFNPLNNERVASCSEDETIRLWNTRTGECEATLQNQAKRVTSLAFAPDGNTLVSGNDDGTLQLWDIQTSQPIRLLKMDRPYERMNILGVQGLTEAQVMMLKALGAIEETAFKN